MIIADSIITQLQFWKSVKYIGFFSIFTTFQLNSAGGTRALITHWICKQKMSTGLSLSIEMVSGYLEVYVDSPVRSQ